MVPLAEHHCMGGYSVLDLPSLLEHLDKLKELTGNLDEYRQLTYEEFVGDRAGLYAFEHILQMALQSVVDIASHIAVVAGNRRPQDYGEAILALGEMKVIPAAFAGKIIGMPKLRNLLVHEYLRIEPRQLYDGLQTGLDDFRRFSEYVTAWLEQEGYLPQAGSEGT
jgi:uncharacterized protein YutE (UPF0331/DUF86 family)